SLLAPLLLPAPPPTEAAHARALQLIERYGVLTREAALGGGAEGGFAGVYPVLKALEERGKVRRGYFVSGLGAAQFAVAGAVDRLRSDTTPVETMVLAATDPAQPYGASLPWPDSAGRPARSVGAYVVIDDGRPVVFIERGGRSMVTFAAIDDTPGWAAAVAAMVDRGQVRGFEIGTVDGESVTGTPVAESLQAAGFTPGYRGLTYRSR
ncbi:MAG: Lhr family helicase, partial [Acidimicrobiales bacterium]